MMRLKENFSISNFLFLLVLTFCNSLFAIDFETQLRLTHPKISNEQLNDLIKEIDLDIERLFPGLNSYSFNEKAKILLSFYQREGLRMYVNGSPFLSEQRIQEIMLNRTQINEDEIKWLDNFFTSLGEQALNGRLQINVSEKNIEKLKKTALHTWTKKEKLREALVISSIVSAISYLGIVADDIPAEFKSPSAVLFSLSFMYTFIRGIKLQEEYQNMWKSLQNLKNSIAIDNFKKVQFLIGTLKHLKTHYSNTSVNCLMHY